MLKENTMLRSLIVILSIASLSVLALWNRTNQDNGKLQSRIEILREDKDKIQLERDSLELDLFNSNNFNGRYELSLEYLKEVNPKAAKQFENYLNHKTE